MEEEKIYETEETRDTTQYRLTGTSGELQSVDGYMNIALEKTAEWVNGAKRREYGDAFVRGNNGEPLFIFSLPVWGRLNALRRHAHARANLLPVMYISADS